MNKFTLKYRTSSRSSHSASAQLPASWSEVPQSLIPAIVAQVALPRSSETYREVLRILFRINKSTWKEFLSYNFSTQASKEDREHNAAMLLDLLTPIWWMWETPLTAKPYDSVTLNRSALSRSKGVSKSSALNPRSSTLLLPDPDLKYLGWGELVDCLIHYELFTSQVVEGTKHLDLLIATFCRPERSNKERWAADWNGDPRVQYNAYHAENQAKNIAKLSEEVKTNVLIYFAGITAQLFSQYQLSDGEDGEEEEYPGQSFTKNTFNMAEKGVFGTYDQTRLKNCHEVLIFLEEHRKDIEAQKEHYESLKNQ